MSHSDTHKLTIYLPHQFSEGAIALQTIKNPDSSPYSFRLWPDKVQALVTYDAMRLNDPTLPFLVRTGRYMPAGLHTPRLTVVAVKDLRERSFPGCFAYFFSGKLPFALCH